MKKIRKVGSVLLGSIGAVVLSSGQAFAALPEGVTAQFDTAKTDGAALAGLGLLVIIAIAVVKYLRKGA